MTEFDVEGKTIILIGMPGSGKTRCGKYIAEILGRSFFDTDEEVVKAAGMSIPEIFERYGEEHFRNLESEAIERLVSLSENAGADGDGEKNRMEAPLDSVSAGRFVIATGGGAVLRPQNVDAMMRGGNTFVIHVYRDIEALPLDGRPLSGDAAALRRMAAVRMPLYEAAANLTLNNTDVSSKEALYQKLKELFGKSDK